MENNGEKNPGEALKLRRERIAEAAKAVGGWKAPVFQGEPSCAAEAEARLLVANFFKGLAAGAKEVEKEMAEALSEEYPADKVLHEFSSEETLGLTVNVVQLYAVEQAAKGAVERLAKETRHAVGELKHGLVKFEDQDLDTPHRMRLYHQLLVKLPPGPANEMEAVKQLLVFPAEALQAAAQECPDGWGVRVPEEWVKEMAEFLAESPEARKLAEAMLDGEVPLEKVGNDGNLPRPVRYLAKVMLEWKKGGKEADAKK